MAGYILKIVIENTHPPVWRRVMVPEKITFGDLHDIIQILFDWDGYHMHGYVTSDNIRIEQDTGEESFWKYGDYYEDEVTIDPFFRKYKWIRYTYDFGDEWRHKILIEKIDESYQGRDVVLMKYKGDNFWEDCGGLWEADESMRSEFDPERTRQRLEALSPIVVKNLKEPDFSVSDIDKLREVYERLKKIVMEAETAHPKEASLIDQKVDTWKRFCEDSGQRKFEITAPEYTQKELLQALNATETDDYCKYLQIPVKVSDSREDKIAAVAEILQAHPEYLLYVFSPEEYDGLCKLSEFPCGTIAKNTWQEDSVIKALDVGLCDFQNDTEKRKLSFALELKPLLKKITAKLKKDTYRSLEKFDKNMLALLQVYGMLELESLYRIYCALYDKNQDKTEFFRCIYWHGSFNRLFRTSYLNDGRCFASMESIDPQKVIAKQEKYAADIEYVSFSKDDIRRLSENLANRTMWMDTLFETLCYRAKMPMGVAEKYLMFIIASIMDGNTVEETCKIVSEWNNGNLDISVSTEIWLAIVGIMLELELPIFKGRSRIQYGEEKNMSPWLLDMTANYGNSVIEKNTHMYELPQNVQEWMYIADGFGDEEFIQNLLDCKKREKICAEEFLYLLCNACITFGKEKEAEELLEELKKSSKAGEKAAEQLRDRLQVRYDTDDWNDEADMAWPWMASEPQKPFVRQSPKIGRNDPCPCGSGKKYKRCCGKCYMR